MANSNNVYQLQDRGSSSDYRDYLAAMDAVSVEKVASASVFYNTRPGNILVDVGMASGTSSNILALLFPQSTVIGVDINPTMVDIASQTYKLPNLQFRVDDGEKLSSFEPNTLAGFFNCSSIHHITSFNNYDSSRAYNTLKRQAELLKNGGVLVVRDFVKPPENEVILQLRSGQSGTTPDDVSLLFDLAKRARSLAIKSEQGFPIKELPSFQKGFRMFKLNYADALEFIRRKDYFENWEVELQEEYGYFSQKEFEEVFKALGLRIIVSSPLYNPWIIRNRYREKFSLFDLEMNDLGFPPTNYLIAGEKVQNAGTSIHLVRHLPDSDNSFLKFKSFQNTETGKIYDVVERPNAVVDVIPYCIEKNKLMVLAKHGYPRPLVNLETDSPILDGKYYGGYITEGITYSSTPNFEQAFKNLTDYSIQNKENGIKSLHYYTSPGGINEKVESIFFQLEHIADSEIRLEFQSGFRNSGYIRSYDAIQLLKTAQTGALVEARLELNLYNLLWILGIPFPEWLGEKIEIHEHKINRVLLDDILKQTRSLFVEIQNNACFLQKNRAKFAEKEIADSAIILEYVLPEKASVNTVITLPVVENNGVVYVGLEVRELPVPQQWEGVSTLLAAPAYRLPKNVTNLKQLEDYLTQIDFYGTRIAGFCKLGEKFFPSIGVTPEQVYPYVVTPLKCTQELKWVTIDELITNVSKIRDGHLLIALFRLKNALCHG